MRWVGRCVLVGALVLSLSSFALGAEFDDLAAAVRIAMAQRDLPRAKEKLDALKAATETEAQRVTSERLDMLYGYLFDFWKSVHSGGQKLLGAEEIMIGTKQVAVVEYDAVAGKLVLRSEGENKRYTLFDMPPRVALTLSEQVLKKGAPENEAFIGTFLAMDAKGDRKLARAAWDRAQAGGVDVKALTPELEVPLPGAAKIELPKLTPQTATTLRPQFWQLGTKDDKGWKRAPLGKQGIQNAQGRLEVAVPEGKDAWLLFGRKLPANFGVRMFLVDTPAGQKLGLFNEKAETLTDVAIDLPEGTVKVEFARRGGEWLCRINDEERALEPMDKDAAKISGTLGLSLPAGAKVVIAGCEFAAQ
jgi:hypothetical protein